MGEKYNGIERGIFSEAYIIFCKYIGIERSDRKYIAMQSECREFVRKYRGTEGHILAKDISVAILNQIDRVDRKRESENIGEQ